MHTGAVLRRRYQARLWPPPLIKYKFPRCLTPSFAGERGFAHPNETTGRSLRSSDPERPGHSPLTPVRRPRGSGDGGEQPERGDRPVLTLTPSRTHPRMLQHLLHPPEAVGEAAAEPQGSAQHHHLRRRFHGRPAPSAFRGGNKMAAGGGGGGRSSVPAPSAGTGNRGENGTRRGAHPARSAREPCFGCFLWYFCPNPAKTLVK